MFAFALALQNLLWGAAQPFAGAVADRVGPVRVICLGAILYAIGLAMMAHSSAPLVLDISAGAMIGFGLSGTSFSLVIAALAKILPAQWRPLAFGLATAAGSFGQFLFSPLAVLLIGFVRLAAGADDFRGRNACHHTAVVRAGGAAGARARTSPRNHCATRSVRLSRIVLTCC